MIRVVNKEEKTLENVLATLSMPSTSNVPIWVYVIFRKNISSGHNKVTVNISTDGPVFWNRYVIYVFCCSCHFDRHERDLIQIFDVTRQRVERICLVDNPVDYAFLPDSLFSYIATALFKLQFVYLRELDLEKINRATVEKLAKHARLKKLIVHGCRNFEALQDFSNLPQLLVVKGEVIGLKAMIGDLGDLCLNSSNSTINNEQKLGSNNTTHNLNGRHRRQDSTNSSSSPMTSFSSEDNSGITALTKPIDTNRRSPIIVSSNGK